MKFFQTLASIDRRIIYLLIAIAVIIPLALKLTSPVRVSGPVKRAYEAVDRLPSGSVVMVSVDFEPSSAPEVYPMLVAILRHALRKDLKIILLGHLVLGQPLGAEALESTAREFNKRYGVDYVNLGYRPGYVALMLGIGKEIRDFFSYDYKAVPFDRLPLMANIHNYSSIDLLAVLTHGDSGDWWVRTAGARYGVKIIVGSTGVTAPDLYPYLQSGQIEGLIGGLQGAAEYEFLIKHFGSAVLGMPAQSFAHGLIILFIILGNIGYFVMRKKT